MQYIVEFLELWWACLTEGMKDQSLAFILSLVIGAAAGGLCWWLSYLSVGLWNRRFRLTMGLQILCLVSALLAVLFAVTFASSRNLEKAVKSQLVKWKGSVLSDMEWQHECFSDTWDAVARAGKEPNVRLSPSPRTDRSITVLPMDNSKGIVARSYAMLSIQRFERDRPYLANILKPSAEVPKELIDVSMDSWFKNSTEAYPLSEGVDLAISVLEDGAKREAEQVAAYTRRLSLALFLITQLIVFIIISFVASSSNRPATVVGVTA